jgi:hypothetical protein
LLAVLKILPCTEKYDDFACTSYDASPMTWTDLPLCFLREGLLCGDDEDVGDVLQVGGQEELRQVAWRDLRGGALPSVNKTFLLKRTVPLSKK